MTITPVRRSDVERLAAVETALDHTVRQLIGVRDELAALRGATLLVEHPRPHRLELTSPLRPELTPPLRPEPVEGAPEPWWQREGAVAKALSIAGAGVLLIGVACLLVLAVQHGWFGPVPRVAAGGILAVGLVGSAVRLHRRQPDNAGVVALAATGVVAGFLDVLAATLLYGWLDPALGLVGAGAVFAVALLLAGWWQRQLLAVVATVGVAVLAPVVGHDHPWTAAAFLVVASATTALTLGDRPWPALHVTRIVATGAVVVGTAVAYADESPVLLPTVAVALALLHAAATLAVEGRRDRRDEHRTPAWLGAGAVGPALVVVLVETSGSATAGCLTLLALLLLGSAVVGRTLRYRSVSVVAIAVVVLVGVAELPSELWFPAATALGVVLLVVSRSPLLTHGSPLADVMAWVGGGAGVLGLLASLAELPGFTGGVGPGPAFLVGQAAATLAWLLVAAVMLLRATGSTRVALLAAGLAVTKLVLVDLSTLDGIVRVLVFLAAGGLLLVVGVRRGRQDVRLP